MIDKLIGDVSTMYTGRAGRALQNKINEIIDYLNEKENGEKVNCADTCDDMSQTYTPV